MWRQRASPEDRVGVSPKKPPRDQGEVVILAVARQIGREGPDDIMLVLAEEQYFLGPHRYSWVRNRRGE